MEGASARQSEAPRDTAVPEQASDWSGSGRILLVEDEDMVRAVAERALTRAGYAVTACADGEEGLIEPLRAAMENALPLTVPIEVDAKVGAN